MKKLYLLISLFLSLNCFSQRNNYQLSVYSEINILTCGPGDVLFEAFGHNAIRVKDPLLNMDLVFNYGTFDFSAPNFYTNFAEGRLEYWVSVSNFKNFEYSYKAQKRWIKEQVLDLTHQEKQEFFNFLYNNALPENRNYMYDPFFDNCSTKLRDITQEILNNKVLFGNSFSSEDRTLRQIMNEELPWNTWGSFGINTALGSKLDKKMTPEEYMYLPDYLYLGFKDATRILENENKLLTKKENVILEFDERPLKRQWLNPMLIFCFLFVLVALITLRDYKRKKRSRILDFFISFITGIVGVFLIYLWFLTDHRTTPVNFNILWAFAPNLILSFFLLKRKLPKWIELYSKFLLGLLFILLVLWVIEVQIFTPVVLPIIGIMITRYYFLAFFATTKK